MNSEGTGDHLVGEILERLRRQLGEFMPSASADAALEQVRRTLRGALGELELVPRLELEGHLATLRELRRTVASLEERIRALEQTPGNA